MVSAQIAKVKSEAQKRLRRQDELAQQWTWHGHRQPVDLTQEQQLATADRLHQWEREKQRTNAALQERSLSTTKPVQPQMSVGSQLITDGTRAGMDDTIQHFESWEGQRERKRLARQREEADAATPSFQPDMSSSSRSVPPSIRRAVSRRGGTAYERLYRLAEMQNAKALSRSPRARQIEPASASPSSPGLKPARLQQDTGISSYDRLERDGRSHERLSHSWPHVLLNLEPAAGDSGVEAWLSSSSFSTPPRGGRRGGGGGGGARALESPASQLIRKAEELRSAAERKQSEADNALGEGRWWLGGRQGQNKERFGLERQHKREIPGRRGSGSASALA